MDDQQKQNALSPQATISSSSKDWRNELFVQMLETGKGADVFFLVGKADDEEKQLICAHKFMLSTVSAVFEGQFLRFDKSTGTEEGCTEEAPIEVPDVSAGAFRAMLRFIYANDASEINKQNAFDVYGAGEKYMIHALVSECRQFLMSGQNLGVDNMFSVLKHAQHHEDKILIAHCWAFVDNNANKFLDSEEFFELSQAYLCEELFSRRTLQADGISLFLSLHRWAIHKCKAAGLEPSAKNKRVQIGQAIYKIPIPRLTEQQFIEYIVPTDLLTKDETIAMFIHYADCRDCVAIPMWRATTHSKQLHCDHCADAKRKYPNRFRRT